VIKAVDIVIPDAGPIISLAHADRLELIEIRLGSLNNGHILSTRSWLAALEDAGQIASAADVIAEIDQHGRMLSRYAADRPVVDAGERSDWLQSILPKREPGEG